MKRFEEKADAVTNGTHQWATCDERIARITEMECRLNRLIAWLADGGQDVAEDVRILDEYYRSPLWRSDFETDEAGELPPDLPRGVLSEDALYNALTEYDENQTAHAEDRSVPDDGNSV